MSSTLSDHSRRTRTRPERIVNGTGGSLDKLRRLKDQNRSCCTNEDCANCEDVFTGEDWSTVLSFLGQAGITKLEMKIRDAHTRQTLLM